MDIFLAVAVTLALFYLNQQSQRKLPFGMMLVIVFIGWTLVLILLSTFKTSGMQLGPVFVSDTGAVIVYILTIGILAATAYGIIRRAGWARKLGIGWYILSMMLASFNLAAYFANPAFYFNASQRYLSPEIFAKLTPAVMTIAELLATVPSFLVSLAIVIYLVRNKDFFVR